MSAPIAGYPALPAFYLLPIRRVMTNPRNFEIALTGPSQQYIEWQGAWSSLSGSSTTRYAKFQATDSRRRKPGGFIPPTSYDMVSDRRVYPQGTKLTIRKFWNGQRDYLWGGSSGAGIAQSPSQAWNEILSENGYPSDLSDTFPSYLRDQARAKAWGKLKQTNVNLGQAWAERGQTAGLVSTNIRRIVSSVQKLRRHPEVLKDIGRGANRIVKDLPNWWLETVFGWQPLLSDIHGAVTELDNRYQDNAGYRITAKASSKQLGRFSGLVVPGLSGHNPSYSSAFSADATQEYGAFVRIDAAPSNDALIKASALGLTNPLSLAWELTPWSFALDWLLPIGQYFDNLDAPLGWDILGMSTSIISKRSLSYKGQPMEDGDWRYTAEFTGSWKYTSLSRSSEVVMPWEITPRFKDPFNSLRRVGTALSLLSQVFGRGPRRSFH